MLSEHGRKTSRPITFDKACWQLNLEFLLLKIESTNFSLAVHPREAKLSKAAFQCPVVRDQRKIGFVEMELKSRALFTCRRTVLS